MYNIEVLFSNLDKIHTTEMGVDRIKRNLKLEDDDVVKWCKAKVIDEESSIIKKGKNWYVSNEDCIITINSYSYTIITAHKIKNKN